MELKLYNTLARKVEVFRSIADEVRMYVCGPTVYDYDHLGHARTYIVFDLLHRLLRHLYSKVTYVQNITDVGHLQNDSESGADKLKARAQETGETVAEIADYFTKAHQQDMLALNVLEPTYQPKASEHIKEIIDFIEGLINSGFAYSTNHGNVYFSVAKDPEYGKLSGRGLAEVISGTRVESAPDKRSSADFALWKQAPTGSVEMVWDSPWGRGFPGWHIECSAMSRKYLGDSFDIHGSAVEHIFPHHENEIAQTESLTKKPMARFWVHSGMLTKNGQKMSKSLRNSVTVREALKKYSANELRLALLLTHYRKPFDYTEKVIEQGVSLRRKLFSYYPQAQDESRKEVVESIIAALLDDLDTPKALALLAQEYTKIGKKDTEILYNLLGLRYTPVKNNPDVIRLIQERDTARQRGDYLTADNRKAEIIARGFEVLDTENETNYIPR